MRQIFFYLTIALFAFGCDSGNNQASIYKVTKFEIDESLYAQTKDSTASQTLKALCEGYFAETFIKFYEKDTITLLAKNGNYCFGKYSKPNKESLNFDLKNFGSFKFNVREEEDNKGNLEYLVLTGVNEANITIKVLLKKDDYYESEKTDLLGVAENQWRFRSNKSETNAQIKQRVLSQLEYMKAYFEFVNEKKYTSFSVLQLYSPFRFYSNGMGIDGLSSAEYGKIFYDQADLDKALKIVGDGLNSISKYPSDPENFTKGYKNAIEEVIRFVKLI